MLTQIVIPGFSSERGIVGGFRALASTAAVRPVRRVEDGPKARPPGRVARLQTPAVAVLEKTVGTLFDLVGAEQ